MHVQPLTRDEIARRVGRDIPDGGYVNRDQVTNTVAVMFPPIAKSFIHENGIWAWGLHQAGSEDPDLINAGKRPVTLVPGASIFHHSIVCDGPRRPY